MASVLTRKILKYHEENPLVNVEKFAQHFKIDISLKQMSQTEVGILTSNLTQEQALLNKKPNFEIIINDSLPIREKNTTIAMLLAEFMLKKTKLLTGEDITLDIFSLKEIRNHRFSKTVQLAARLVVPEQTLAKFRDLTNDHEKYAKKINISPEFINCLVKNHSLEFLISNDMIWGQNTLASVLNKEN